MRKLTLFLLLFYTGSTALAGKIYGTVATDKGVPLPYASVSVKGTTRGTTANSEGRYFLQLQPGSYTIVCQYVGYKREEKQVTVTADDQELNFALALQEFVLGEVIVKKGEDPAYEIIRQAIRKRTYYQAQPGNFQCEVYTKGQFRLRDYPRRLFGDDVEFGDGDTSKRKMLYLSETVSTYSVQQPNKVKVEVLSSKVSGQSDGFGLSAPQIISFYNNLITISDILNPRGFISPISDNALNYYRYKYEGAFFEDGRQVNRIQVIPKRKYEPLFSGYINIVEDEWRIHSVQLQLIKASQMEVLDTLRIEQLYIPYNNDIWIIKSQVIYPAVKMLGFDAHGSFVNIYSKFDIAPSFKKGFWDNTVLKYLDSSNKKSTTYWETNRPVPLQSDEIHDYKIKDSLELVRKDPAYLDSLDRLRNRVRVSGLVLYGKTFTWGKKRSSFTLDPILSMVNYNTVEGLVLDASGTYTRRLDTTAAGRRSIFISPDIRYGFNNRHFNANLTAGYRFGKKYFNSISISGGKRVLQFNNAGPVNPRVNTTASLYFTRNYMKIYEAWFGKAVYTSVLGEGFTLNLTAEYQDRLPLENTTDYRWKKYNNRQFTPNYPTELLTENFKRHQAFLTSVAVSWQPGTKYVELPGRKINIGSAYPRFTLNYTQALQDIFGSDVQYSKWSFAVSDDIRLRLAGQLSYRLGIGGFLHIDSVNVQDYTHFNGNKFLRAAPYLNSFQLASYYEYSNTENFYSIGHVEYHLNGFLTNKIPGFRRLHWHLVTGANAFYVNKDRNYVEVFAGLENVFKIFRVDFVQAWQTGKPGSYGIRVGIRGR
ncbi:MAG: DUF5686 and carboxypeptidase regulatory-like domain-containing protein [Chitinophagaceae bacterium]